MREGGEKTGVLTCPAVCTARETSALVAGGVCACTCHKHPLRLPFSSCLLQVHIACTSLDTTLTPALGRDTTKMEAIKLQRKYPQL